MQGLWEVQQLTLEGKEVTPFFARWLEFRDDGSFIQGVGKRIEEIGTWEQLVDGSFNVMLTDGRSSRLNGMRLNVDGDSAKINIIDEGQLLVASLARVQTIPLAAWDMCIGEWEQKNPDDEEQLFMFVDHRYVHKQDGASSSGYWIISTNLQDLSIIEDNGQITNWTISFPADSTMRWLSEFGEQKEFIRAN